MRQQMSQMKAAGGQGQTRSGRKPPPPPGTPPTHQLQRANMALRQQVGMLQKRIRMSGSTGGSNAARGVAATTPPTSDQGPRRGKQVGSFGSTPRWGRSLSRTTRTRSPPSRSPQNGRSPPQNGRGSGSPPSRSPPLNGRSLSRGRSRSPETLRHRRSPEDRTPPPQRSVSAPRMRPGPPMDRFLDFQRAPFVGSSRRNTFFDADYNLKHQEIRPQNDLLKRGNHAEKQRHESTGRTRLRRRPKTKEMMMRNYITRKMRK